MNIADLTYLTRIFTSILMTADPGQVPISWARRRGGKGQMVVLGVNGNCIAGYRLPNNLIAAKLFSLRVGSSLTKLGSR
jgi:hypothetical protein